MKPTLLIIVDWFTPGYKAGGPIRSSLNLAMALKDDYTIQVLTTDTDHGATVPYIDIEANTWTHQLDPKVSVYYARKSSLKLRQLKEQILKANADFIYLNHVWSPRFVLYPLWLKWTGIIKGKVILCPRGGLYESALQLKRYKKTLLLRLMRWMKIEKHVLFHATNQREKEAIQKFFPGSSVVIADNLPSTFQPPFNTCLKEVGLVKCVFIARVVPIKNLLYLLQLLQEVKARVDLSIIGPLEDEVYWQACKAEITTLPAHIQVNFLGPRENSELVNIVQQHHLFVLPTTGENFGHSIFEAFLSGRPVLISDQTPWLKLKEKVIGWDVSLNEPGCYAAVIEEVASMDQQEFDLYCKNAWEFAFSFNSNPEAKQGYFNLFS